MMYAELLYVHDCRNVGLARERLAEAAARAGVEVVVRERVVSDAAAAVEHRMPGSPTVLIDGHDVAGTAEPSISCRLYRTTTGIDAAPSVDDLVAALSR